MPRKKITVKDAGPQNEYVGFRATFRNRHGIEIGTPYVYATKTQAIGALLLQFPAEFGLEIDGV